MVSKKDFIALDVPKETMADLVKRETPDFIFKNECEGLDTPVFDFETSFGTIVTTVDELRTSSSMPDLKLLIAKTEQEKLADRFSFLPLRSQSSAFDLTSLFKSDKLYNGMISELFKTRELRNWRGRGRDDL